MKISDCAIPAKAGISRPEGIPCGLTPPALAGMTDFVTGARFPSTQPFVNPLARVYGPAMHIHGLIEDSATLANLCTRLAQQPFITVDTEFMRENTFWPELCLIQIADTNEAAAIDPMAEGIDLTPCSTCSSTMRTCSRSSMPAARIWKSSTISPATPRIRCSTPRSRRWRSARASRSAIRTWSKNHLGDHRRKRGALHRLVAPSARQAPDRLCDRGRDPSLGNLPEDAAEAAQDRARRLARRGDGADPQNREKFFRNDPDQAGERIRISSPKAEVLGRLKALAAWREKGTQGKNLPRGRIVKDETIADLAANPPRKQADLTRVRGPSASWGGNDIGGRLMAAIENATAMPASEMPARDDRKLPLGKEGALVADLLKLLLKPRARDINVAARLLAFFGRSRSARRGPARQSRDSRRMAVRAVRARCARAGRGSVGVYRAQW
ncbi:HRDC domain-containing protein [Ditylenchus destructor]|uniref:HRDC domain-containing protein n=1 Tax=Ditylenchus destructor TaxID=166010 RepID=A0AAD4MDU6_9BILA|nr:HRDC domain-containing protein [Ditylenchus destructor]